MGAAVAALSVGALAKATQAAAEFEEQMVEVEKVTNPETSREMGDAIQDMASEMPVAQRELAGIAAQAGRFGIQGSENIERFSRTVAEMAVATDLSTDQAGRAFAKMTTLLGESIDNVEALGSVINELSNTMAVSSSEITDSATRSAGALTQLGLTSEQVLALNATMNEVSATARIAGTQLRRFAQEIRAPGNVEAFANALGITASEFRRMREQSPNELIERLVGTFQRGGDSADALREALSTTSRQTLSKLAQNTEGLSSAQETANEQMDEATSLTEEYEAASDTFNSRLQVTRNRIRNIAISIGENLLPHATNALEAFNGLLERVSSINEQTDGMAGTIGLIAGALGGLAVAASQAISFLGGTSAVVSALGTAVSVLTGPIGVAIAAIAGLAAIWTSNVFGIRDKTLAAFDAITSVIAKQWARHGDELVAEARETWQVVSNRIQTAMEFINRNIIQPHLRLARALWRRFGDEIMLVVNFLKRTVLTSMSNFLDGMLTAIRITLALIRGDWGEAWTLFANFTDRMMGRINSIVDDGLGVVLELFRRAGQAFFNAGRALIDHVQAGIQSRIDSMIATLRAGVRRAINSVPLVSPGDVGIGGGGGGGGAAPPGMRSGAALVRGAGAGGGQTVNNQRVDVSIDRVEAQDAEDFAGRLGRELKSRGIGL